VIVISYTPYATSSVLSARAARSANASLISIADCANAPMAEGADHVLLFEGASSPGFFPSLIGAIAIAQSLAAVTFSLGGARAKKRLQQAEARLSAMSQYVVE
jgi:DNA-binding MurR/RpiR family transcriptional regulator